MWNHVIEETILPFTSSTFQEPRISLYLYVNMTQISVHVRRVCLLCSLVQLEKAFRRIILKLNIEIIKSNSVIWECESLCSQGIEQLKKEERRWAKRSKWMNMKVVFGHPFSLAWLSPFATPDHGKANLYQYVVWDGDPSSTTSPLLSLHKHVFLLFTSVYSWRSVSERSDSTETLATRF